MKPLTQLPYQKKMHYDEFLEEIVMQIVDHPHDVEVDEEQTDDGVLSFVIKVNKQDKGKLIGKQGTTIGSLHKLFVAISRQYVKMNISDNDTDQDTDQPV